jgi:AcrR family transcriptional regulator
MFLDFEGDWESMTVTKKTRKQSDIPRLGREDWLDAAFHAVVDGGVDSVRVLLLAQTLGVSRGSFYWHFADHAELIRALLERWQLREAQIDTDVRAQSTNDPVADLHRLLDAALAHAGPDHANMRFELALRAQGRHDAALASLLQGVDQARMSLFQQKFQRITGNTTTAIELALLFYLAIVGSNQALSRPHSPTRLRDYLQGLITHYLIHPHVAQKA